jgi:hypothetical protein
MGVNLSKDEARTQGKMDVEKVVGGAINSTSEGRCLDMDHEAVK